MYIVGFDQQGMVNDIHVYQFEECSEEMPQHLSPLMKQNMMPMGGMGQQNEQYITRSELESMLKEMLPNAQPTQAEPPAPPRPGNQSATANAGRTR